MITSPSSGVVARLPVLPHRADKSAPLWRLAQWIAVVALLATVGGLVVFPDFTLTMLWNVVIPIVPLSLLIHPTIWRNVCPLATLNQAVGARSGARSLGTGAVGSGALTVFAFVAMVPLRTLVLDSNAAVLAGVLVALMTAALGAGFMVRDRGGFCHLICPVLPAERLYGHAPLVGVPSARCDACSVCTPRGCPELAGNKALLQVLGPARKDHRWTLGAWGFGFLGFPGLVLAFFTLPEGAADSIAASYGWIVGGAGVSWLALAAATVLFALGPRMAVSTAAALAFALYYWYAGPRLVEAIHATPQLGQAIRVAMIVTAVLWWMAQARRSARGVA